MMKTLVRMDKAYQEKRTLRGIVRRQKIFGFPTHALQFPTRLTIVASYDDRRRPIGGHRRVERGPGVDEKLNDIGVAVLRSHEERGPAVVAHPVNHQGVHVDAAPRGGE